MTGLIGSLRQTGGIRTVAAAAFLPTSTTSSKSILDGTKSLLLLQQKSLKLPFILFSSSSSSTTPPTTTEMNSSLSVPVVPRLKTCDATVPLDGPVLVKGWVRTLRKQKTLAFVEVNDGSNLGGIQCVLMFDSVDDETREGTGLFNGSKGTLC